MAKRTAKSFYSSIELSTTQCNAKPFMYEWTKYGTCIHMCTYVRITHHGHLDLSIFPVDRRNITELSHNMINAIEKPPIHPITYTITMRRTRNSPSAANKNIYQHTSHIHTSTHINAHIWLTIANFTKLQPTTRCAKPALDLHLCDWFSIDLFLVARWWFWVISLMLGLWNFAKSWTIIISWFIMTTLNIQNSLTHKPYTSTDCLITVFIIFPIFNIYAQHSKNFNNTHLYSATWLHFSCQLCIFFYKYVNIF